MHSLLVVLFVLGVGVIGSKGVPPCEPCKCSTGSRVWPGRHVAECDYVNNMTVIPGSDLLSPYIQVLWVNGGVLTTLVQNQFTSFNQLEIIYVVRSEVKNVESHAFRYMSNVTEISLQDNLISDLPSDLFNDTPHLAELWLTGNRLKVLKRGQFSNLKYLKSVYLISNEITTIEEGTFANVPVLENLILRENKLTTLDLNIIDDFRSLKMLSLINNPWNCDETLCGVMDLVVGGVGATPTCVAPPHLAGNSWSLLLPYFEPAILISDSNQISQKVGRATDVQEGDDVTLQCKYCFASHVTWSLNGVKLPRSYHSTSQKTLMSSLTMEKIHKEEQGNYVCQVRNCQDCDTSWLLVTVNTTKSEPKAYHQVFHVANNSNVQFNTVTTTMLQTLSQGVNISGSD